MNRINAKREEQNAEPSADVPQIGSSKLSDATLAGVPKPETSRHELLEKVYDAIRTNKGRSVNEEVLQQLRIFRNAGFDVVAGLMELYHRSHWFQERKIIVLALKHDGTMQAVAAMKRIASEPGDCPGALARVVVDAIVSSENSQDEISQFLLSKSADIRDATAAALKSKELTEVTVERLGVLLKSDAWTSHNLVAIAFATDLSSKTAGRKIELLMQALPQVHHLQNGTSIDTRIGSVQEFVLNQYVFAVASMPGAEAILVNRSAGVAAGSVEYVVLWLGLALRNDKAARSAMIEIAVQDKSGNLRSLAVRGLGLVGSADDIKFLRRIAIDDAYTVAPPDEQNDSKVVYPVRREAERAIQLIQKREDGDDK